MSDDLNLQTLSAIMQPTEAQMKQKVEHTDQVLKVFKTSGTKLPCDVITEDDTCLCSSFPNSPVRTGWPLIRD